MVGCESKAAGRSHSGLRGFFPLLLPGPAASFFCACAREAGYGDLLFVFLLRPIQYGLASSVVSG